MRGRWQDDISHTCHCRPNPPLLVIFFVKLSVDCSVLSYLSFTYKLPLTQPVFIKNFHLYFSLQLYFHPLLEARVVEIACLEHFAEFSFLGNSILCKTEYSFIFYGPFLLYYMASWSNVQK